MAVTSLSWKEARRALAASGMGSGQSLGLLWPFGRDKRTRALLRDRRAVLEAKNLVVDYLFRAQRPLAPLRLMKAEHLQQALQDPEKRRMVMSLGVNRAMMEDVLLNRYGAEVGRALGKALSELVASGVLMRTPAMSGPNQEVYVAAQGRARPQFDLSALNRLLQEGRDFTSELQARFQKRERTDTSRTHHL